MLLQSFLKIYFAFLFAALLFVTTGFSQSTSYLDSLDGKFALQFRITNNFSLSNFQGTILSGKYHFSNRDAIRLGVSLQFDDSESDEINKQKDTNLVIRNIENLTGFSITINTQYMRYIHLNNDIGLFSGGGPFISYTSTTSKNEQIGIEETHRSERTSDSFSAGLDMILGVEWMFYRYMSLSAEYGIKFFYYSSNRVFDGEFSISETNENSFRITHNHVNFGITVYF